MAAPVWVLSVDLQAKTATFATGMAEAARSARTAFSDIKSSSKEGGEGVAESSLNMRSAIGLLDNTIRGNHAAAMADLVREFQNTQVVMALLPFAAVIGGIGAIASIAVEVASKVKEWREQHEKLTNAQTQFKTASDEAFNGLNEKILEAGIRTDELRNDHLGALQKTLQEIDHSSMQELVKQLETIAKAADAVFGTLESHWYTFGIGSAGAKHALDQFQLQYTSLMQAGKEGEAGDLLKGTLASAEKVLAAQKQAAANSGRSTNSPDETSRISAQFQAAYVQLKAAGVGYTEKEVAAQEQLVQALNSQVGAQSRVAQLKAIEDANAKRGTANEASGRESEGARAAIASQLRTGELAVQADKSTANAQLEIKHASIQERLAVELDYAARSRDIQLAANQQDAAALDKASKDYQNQLKASREKAAEIEAAYATSTAELRSRALVEQNKKDITDVEQSERDKIAATQEGSAARLSAIEQASAKAASLGLQDTDFYRQLGQQRIEQARRMADDEAKLKADAGKEEADNTLKMGQLALAAEMESQALINSARRVTDAQQAEQETANANREFRIKQAALQQQAQALDTTSKDYENKLQAIQNKERQLVQQHENELTEIKDKAAIAQNTRMKSAYQQLASIASSALTEVVMQHQSFAAAVASIGSQVVSSMTENAIKSALTMKFGQEAEAAKAARIAFIWGWEHGGVAAPVLAPAMGAVAFASMMAFEAGGVVPGAGRGISCPQC